MPAGAGARVATPGLAWNRLAASTAQPVADAMAEVLLQAASAKHMPQQLVLASAGELMSLFMHPPKWAKDCVPAFARAWRRWLLQDLSMAPHEERLLGIFALTTDDAKIRLTRLTAVDDQVFFTSPFGAAAGTASARMVCPALLLDWCQQMMEHDLVMRSGPDFRLVTPEAVQAASQLWLAAPSSVKDTAGYAAGAALQAVKQRAESSHKNKELNRRDVGLPSRAATAAAAIEAAGDTPAGAAAAAVDAAAMSAASSAPPTSSSASVSRSRAHVSPEFGSTTHSTGSVLLPLTPQTVQRLTNSDTPKLTRAEVRTITNYLLAVLCKQKGASAAGAAATRVDAISFGGLLTPTAAFVEWFARTCYAAMLCITPDTLMVFGGDMLRRFIYEYTSVAADDFVDITTACSWSPDLRAAVAAQCVEYAARMTLKRVKHMVRELTVESGTRKSSSFRGKLPNHSKSAAAAATKSASSKRRGGSKASARRRRGSNSSSCTSSVKSSAGSSSSGVSAERSAGSSGISEDGDDDDARSDADNADSGGAGVGAEAGQCDDESMDVAERRDVASSAASASAQRRDVAALHNQILRMFDAAREVDDFAGGDAEDLDDDDGLLQVDDSDDNDDDASDASLDDDEAMEDDEGSNCSGAEKAVLDDDADWDGASVVSSVASVALGAAGAVMAAARSVTRALWQ